MGKYDYKGFELDTDLLVANLVHNYEKYANSIAKNNSQRLELNTAFETIINAIKNNRISTTVSGNLYDSSGELSDDRVVINYYDNLGNFINKDLYNQLKDKDKSKYNSFNPYGKIVNFVNTIAKEVYNKVNKPKEEPKNEKLNIQQDLNTRFGFTENDIDLTPYLNKDTVDEYGKRTSNLERSKFIAQELKTLYPNYTNNKDLNSFITALETNGFNDNAKILADKLGFSSSWYNMFFATDKPISLEELDKKAKEEEAIKLEKEKNILYEKFIAPKLTISYKPYLRIVDTMFKNPAYRLDILNGWDFNMNDVLSKIAYDIKWYYPWKDNGYSEKNYLEEILNDKLKLFEETGEIERSVLHYLITSNLKKFGEDRYKNAVSEPQRIVRIRLNKDKDSNYTLIWNFDTQKLEYVPLYQTQSGQKELQEQFLLQYPKYFSDKNKLSSIRFNKIGGIIRRYQIGGVNELIEEVNRERAKEKGITKHQLLNLERAPLTEGLSKTDYLRLGSVVADIASMLAAFGIGGGTLASAATGLASTTGTFMADVLEDGFQWSDAGNALLGAGLDLVGLIPALGTSAKAGKIVKNLKKYGNYIVNTLATIELSKGITNFPEITNAFKKLGNDEDLTLQDWKYLYLGLTTILGGIGAANKFVKSKPKKIENQVALQFQDNNSKKTVIFSGEDATKIRQAKSIDEINDVLKGYKDYGTLLTNSSGILGTDILIRLPFKKGEGLNPINYLQRPLVEVDQMPELLDVQKVRRLSNNWFWKGRQENLGLSNPIISGIKAKPKSALIVEQPSLTKPKRQTAKTKMMNEHRGKTDSEIFDDLVAKGKIDDNYIIHFSPKILMPLEDYLKAVGAVQSKKQGGILKFQSPFSPLWKSNTTKLINDKFSKEKLEKINFNWLNDAWNNINQVLQLGTPETSSISPYYGKLSGDNDNNYLEIELPKEKWFDSNLMFGLPRLISKNRTNKRILDTFIKNQKPFLVKPFTYNSYESGNYDPVHLAENYAANLLNSVEVTSDPILNFAMRSKAYMDGISAKTQGFVYSNHMNALARAKNEQQSKENALAEYQANLQNQLSIKQIKDRIIDAKLAHEKQLSDNLDTFAKDVQTDITSKWTEHKQRQELYNDYARNYNIKFNLGKYAPNLSTDALEVWNNVNTGLIKAINLDETLKQLYQEAAKAYETAVLTEKARYYKLNRILLFTPTTSPRYNIINTDNKPI